MAQQQTVASPASTPSAPDESALRAYTELCAAVGKLWESDEESLDRQNALSYFRFSRFDDPERTRAVASYYRSCLSCIDGLDRKTGLDVGCWLGLSTAAMVGAGAGRVIGVDIRQHNARAAERWRRELGVETLRFRPMRDGVIPLRSGSVDWAIFNQVLCNAPPGTFVPSLREAFRVLKPGGTLIFCDNNNPYCPDTEARLKREFHAAEIGDGTPQAPNGINFVSRFQLIKMAGPYLEDEQARMLARNSCYMWGDELKEVIHTFLQTRRIPASAFDPASLRSPVLPTDGAANGNVTDPFELCRILEEIGFGQVDITSRPPRRRLDDDAMWDELTRAMSVAIFADKPG